MFLWVVRLCLVGVTWVPGRAGEDTTKDGKGGDVVVLDKFTVEAPIYRDALQELMRKRRQWLYTTIEDYELLSQCGSTTTAAVAAHLQNSLILDREFVPASHLGDLAGPMKFIMFDCPTSKALQQLIPSTMAVVDSPKFGRDENTFKISAGGTAVSDTDTLYAVQNRSGMPWEYAGGGLGKGPVPMGLLFRLSQSRPRPPDWYCYGFIGPCGLLRMGTFGRDEMLLANAMWLSEAQTEEFKHRFRANGEAPRMPPLQNLLERSNDSCTGARTEWPSPEWMAEAALFLRWGLYNNGKENPHRAAFEAFVRRSRIEPTNEAMFKECFGFGYAEMQRQLAAYLIQDGEAPIAIPFDRFRRWRPEPPERQRDRISVRAATPAEVARILGDWLRLEANRHRAEPTIRQLYLDEAGRLLDECYEGGEREPRFLAVVGLYKRDIGDLRSAESILALATKGEWTGRPSAYEALATLRVADLMTRVRSEHRTITDRERADVLSPLTAVRAHSALGTEDYALIAEVWMHSGTGPTSDDLEVFIDGMARYPRCATIVTATTEVCAQWGYQDEAKSLAALGRKRFGDGFGREPSPRLAIPASAKAPR